MNRDRKIDRFLCILWKVFQVLTRKQGEEIPSGPLYCPTSSALRCISNLVRNTNQEVISARGATCHTQPCIGQYKGLLWWTINRPAPSQIRFPLWTFLHTNDQFCVWKVDTLFTFVGFLPLLKSSFWHRIWLISSKSQDTQTESNFIQFSDCVYIFQ